MEITTESKTICSPWIQINEDEWDLPPPLIQLGDVKYSEYDEMDEGPPPLVQLGNVEYDEIDEGPPPLEEIEDDLYRLVNDHDQTMQSLDDLLKELESIQFNANVTSDVHLDTEEIVQYGDEMEKAYSTYWLKKIQQDAANKVTRQILNNSIDNLRKTAEFVHVDKFYVAESVNTVVPISPREPQYATYETVQMPTPQRAVYFTQSDDVQVRIFTVQDLKWNGGPDLVDPKNLHLPENQSFMMPKDATWGDSLWREISNRMNLTHYSSHTAFLFRKRTNGTIRPTDIIEDEVPLSTYQTNNKLNDEVWILILDTPVPKNNEVIVHKKWFHKGWFYYQGFDLVGLSEKLFDVVNYNDFSQQIKKKYDIAFEEVCGIGDKSKMRVTLLDMSMTIDELDLFDGDIVIYSSGQHLGAMGQPIPIDSNCITDCLSNFARTI
jgi:hypothetical protein